MDTLVCKHPCHEWVKAFNPKHPMELLIINIHGFGVEVVVNYDQHMVWCWLCMSLEHIIKKLPKLGWHVTPLQGPSQYQGQGGHHGNKVHANLYPWRDISPWQQPQGRTCLKKGNCKIGVKKSPKGFQFVCCKNHLRSSTWPNGKKIKSKWNNLLLPWQGGMKVAVGCTWPRKYIDHYWKKNMWMRMGIPQCKSPLFTSFNICNIQRHMWSNKLTL